MGCDDAALPESVVKKLEVGLLEQALSGTLRVRRVGDDDVEGVLVVIQELETVANMDLDLRMLVALSKSGQILLGQADDGLRISVS